MDYQFSFNRRMLILLGIVQLMLLVVSFVLGVQYGATPAPAVQAPAAKAPAKAAGPAKPDDATQAAR